MGDKSKIERNRRLMAEIRRAVADYMGSEGCSCCRDIDRHREDKKRLAKLLRVPEDKSIGWYDFSKFRSSRRGLI